MNRKEFIQYLDKKKILISDGATGTNLIKRGLPNGITGEQWVMDNPTAIQQLHEDFIAAGSDIILTCTFGASQPRLEHSGLGKHFEDINKKAVEIAKQARKNKNVLIAGSVGPLGEMMEPFGTISEADALNYYSEQIKILAAAGVDLLVIETQFDLKEAKAALNAAENNSDLAVICSFSFDRGTKTMMGVSPSAFAEDMKDFKLAGIGINCGKSLEDNTAALEELIQQTENPVWFKPNAGLPKIGEDGLPTYDIAPAAMAENVPNWLKIGARIIGGCCGSSPAHIREIAKTAKNN